MKRTYKEPEFEIFEYSLSDGIATEGLSGGPDWGEISLDGGYQVEVDF